MFKTIDECRLELVSSSEIPLKIKGETEEGLVLEVGIQSDWLPVAAARASFGKEDKTGEDENADRKLLKFLADNRHVSVFEHNYATFLIECPIFVARQIMRHKSFSFNEVSRRYTSENIEFWIPDKWRKQSKSNKQASTNEEADGYDARTGVAYDLKAEYEGHIWDAMNVYDMLIECGVAREIARAVLPQSLLTRFYMTGNLRSWWSFLTSRLKKDTQYETRVIAKRINDTLTEWWPNSMGALMGSEYE